MGLEQIWDLSWSKLPSNKWRNHGSEKEDELPKFNQELDCSGLMAEQGLEPPCPALTPWLCLPCPLPFSLHASSNKSRRIRTVPSFVFPHSTADQSRLRDHRSPVRWNKTNSEPRAWVLCSVSNMGHIYLWAFSKDALIDLHQHWGTHQLVILTDMVLGQDLEDFPQPITPRTSHRIGASHSSEEQNTRKVFLPKTLSQHPTTNVTVYQQSFIPLLMPFILQHITKAFRRCKTSISALLTTPKPSTVWITINCGKFWKRWEYQTTWPASWETCRQVRKQQLELDMEQQTGSK